MKTWGIIVLLIAVLASPLPSVGRTASLPNYGKGQALLRLEDITPGSPYRSPDELGRLRAVFTYLQQQHVPFAVAVIPRAVFIGADGSRYDCGLDDEKPAENVRQLAHLLRNAQAKGAVLGMHGYTHQYGMTALPDGNQNTGVGFEFNVHHAPETKAVSYAAQRIEKSLRAFEREGLVPAFWESPHYNDTRAQEEVFRSYMGILYQPDFRSLTSFRDMTVYETDNTYRRSSTGSVYVPAPLKYVHASRPPAVILHKLRTYKGLASMFYHPYLEFEHMEPVYDANGKPVIEDGLPLYRYRAQDKSGLQQLVAGVRASGFTWSSLHDVVPFTPAHRLTMRGKPEHLLAGHVTESGGASLVFYEGGAVYVQQGDFRWPRNRNQPPAQRWLTRSFTPDERLVLADLNGDRRTDLLVYDRISGNVSVFHSTGTSFADARTCGRFSPGGTMLVPGDYDGDGDDDMLFRRGAAWEMMHNTDGQFVTVHTGRLLHKDSVLLSGDTDGDGAKEWLEVSLSSRTVRLFQDQESKERGIQLPEPFDMPEDIHWLTGDTNGDGKSDLLAYDAASGIWDIWRSDGTSFQKLPAVYGPWGRGAEMAVCADFDGWGRADISVWQTEHQEIDISLSFQSNKR